jgi:hypothetical protein
MHGLILHRAISVANSRSLSWNEYDQLRVCSAHHMVKPLDRQPKIGADREKILTGNGLSSIFRKNHCISIIYNKHLIFRIICYSF